MKKLALIIILSAVVLCVSSCGVKETVQPHSEDVYADLYPEITDNNDTSSNAIMLGDTAQCEYDTFYEYMVDADADYTFSVHKTASKTVDGLKWYIYVLDERFTSGLRYLYESGNPDLTVTVDEPVSFNLKAGQYVYCFCSYNGYNAASGTDAGGYLQIKRGS